MGKVPISLPKIKKIKGTKKSANKLISTHKKSKKNTKLTVFSKKNKKELNNKDSKFSGPKSPKKEASNNKVSILHNNPEPSKKANDNLKLKFKKFSGNHEDFKSLLDSNVSQLGPYKGINFKPKKVVVSFNDKETLESYLSFYNKFVYKDEPLSVSLLDFFSSVKSDYKVLKLSGIPDDYDLESVEKGLKRRIEIEFKITKENDYHKLRFKSVSDCVKANSILNNCRIPLVKNKNENLVQVTTTMELFGKSSRNSSRVFVRNLPFNTTHDELLNFFKQYDRGVKVHIPSKSKGFAFVNFSSLEKSNKLINKLNRTPFKKRKIHLSLSLPKELYTSSKDKLKEVDEEVSEDEDKGDEGEEEEVEDVEGPNDSRDETDDGMLHDTIFVRNLDYECTEKELSEYFSKFGEVLSCNICKREDNSSKGTAFVRLKNKEQVKQIIENEQLSLLRDKELNNQKPVMGLGFTLRGRRLKLDLALGKEEARLLKEKNAEDENKKLKEQKNLHLLMVGVVTEDSPQFEKLKQDQQESIKQSISDKLEKIKQNNTYVNPKRICIKNLPSNVRTNDLRSVIYKHLKNVLTLEEYLRLKKLKNRGVVDVKLLKGDSYTKDDKGMKVKKNKPFAFVQFVDHNIAMKTLQFLSNNNTIYPEKVLQCEFTVDTKFPSMDRKVKAKGERTRKRTYSRGKRQREKRRLMKLNSI